MTNDDSDIYCKYLTWAKTVLHKSLVRLYLLFSLYNVRLRLCNLTISLPSFSLDFFSTSGYVNKCQTLECGFIPLRTWTQFLIYFELTVSFLPFSTILSTSEPDLDLILLDRQNDFEGKTYIS